MSNHIEKDIPYLAGVLGKCSVGETYPSELLASAKCAIAAVRMASMNDSGLTVRKLVKYRSTRIPLVGVGWTNDVNNRRVC